MKMSSFLSQSGWNRARSFMFFSTDIKTDTYKTKFQHLKTVGNTQLLIRCGAKWSSESLVTVTSNRKHSIWTPKLLHLAARSCCSISILLTFRFTLLLFHRMALLCCSRARLTNQKTCSPAVTQQRGQLNHRGHISTQEAAT